MRLTFATFLGSWVLCSLLFAQSASLNPTPVEQKLETSGAQQEGGDELAVAPSAEEIQTMVRQLGEGDAKKRFEAAAKIEALCQRFPRWMMQELTEAWKATDNLEARAAVERLLYPLVDRYVYSVPQGFIGISMEAQYDTRQRDNVTLLGVKVLALVEGYPGEKAGLEEGDVITEIEGVDLRKFKLPDQVTSHIASFPPGYELTPNVIRGKKARTIVVPLGQRPDDLPIVQGLSPEQKKRNFESWLISIDQLGIHGDASDPIGHFE